MATILSLTRWIQGGRRIGVSALFITLAIPLVPLDASARSATQERPSPRPEALPDVMGHGHVLTAGNIAMKVTNWGIVGNPFTNLSNDPSAQWPGASGVEYLNFIGLAVGVVNPYATDPAEVRRVSYRQEWAPATNDFEDRIYDTFDGDVNGAPYANDDGDVDPTYGEPRIDEDFLDGRDNDGDGLIDEDFGALGQQMFSLVMRDDGPQSTANDAQPHAPMHLECRQRAWAYSLSGYTNFNAIEYTIINRSGHTLDSLTLGWQVDADLGPVAAPSYNSDDRDLPRFPSGEFVRVLTPDDVQRQYPHDPSVNMYVPSDSALCPRLRVRVNGFSFADGDGDGGQTRGVATFLLLGHTLDPTGINGPTRVGFRSFRRFQVGTPFNAGGNPGNDQERFELMTSTEGIDPGTGFISQPPAASASDYAAWCSIGPFRNIPDGGKIQATVAFAVAPEDYATASQYENDYADYQAGSLGARALFAKYPPLANAVNVQNFYEGAHVITPGPPVPDFHGRETPVRLPPGTPMTLVVEDCAGREPRAAFVNDRDISWFDFDCDYCTGVWDYPSLSGRFHRNWTASVPLVAVEPAPRAPAAGGLRILASLPNPTRGESQLQFQLAERARVRVEVHDLGGRLMSVVSDAELDAGTHRIAWDGSEKGGRPAPSGIYFWRVTAAGRTASEKLLLAR